MVNSPQITNEADIDSVLRSVYRVAPELYAIRVLKVKWWAKQKEIADALVKYHKVFVKASHAVGKTFLAAGLTNWFFDCFENSRVITTAPNAKQVDEVLWAEVRDQRNFAYGEPLDLAPKASKMSKAGSDTWFAVGMTAADANAFQGRHGAAVLIIFDEATGIDGEFYDAAEGMMTNANNEVYWLCICNPTDPTTRAYHECQKGSMGEPKPGQFKVIEISALDHPNIAADLAGEELPFPFAVGRAFIDKAVDDWSEPIDPADRLASDVEWPPKSGNWYRPGPLMEGKVLGRWPLMNSKAIWSDAMWRRALEPKEGYEESKLNDPLVIGADLAAGGEDFTTITARRGKWAIWWETHNGWSPKQIADRCKELATKFVQDWEIPERVAIQVDGDAVGWAIVQDHAGDFNFITVSGAKKAINEEGYPNLRSEAWFLTAERANVGDLDLSMLPKMALDQLESQLKSPEWALDNRGRRAVEKKVKTKERLKRSPDDADSLNLAFYPAPKPLWSMRRNVAGQHHTTRAESHYQDNNFVVVANKKSKKQAVETRINKKRMETESAFSFARSKGSRYAR